MTINKPSELIYNNNSEKKYIRAKRKLRSFRKIKILWRV